jgi:hypothetical protein
MIKVIQLYRSITHIINVTDSLLFQRGTKEVLLGGEALYLLLKIV